MAVVGTALLDKFIGTSEAEKAFQPWWDTVEDFLVYGLIMLGLVAMPTTMFSATPLDCTICNEAEGNCDFLNEVEESKNWASEMSAKLNNTGATKPDFSAWWTKKYCTMTSVDKFTLYFPYVLLIMPLIMVAVEKGFVKVFKAGMKLEVFYNLLVKDLKTNESANPAETCVFVENRRDVIEISQTFHGKSDFFRSYVLRTIMEVVLGLLMLAWLCVYGLQETLEEPYFGCNVYGYWYNCAGHPIAFYFYILCISIVILGIYFICAFYAIIWLTCSCLGALSRVMYSYRAADPENGCVKGGLERYYYNSKDLRLILDLLAESSGAAASLRVISQFDTEFNLSFNPGDVKLTKIDQDPIFSSKNIIGEGDAPFEQAKIDAYGVKINFEHAPAFTGIYKHMKDIAYMYTIEVLEKTGDTTKKIQVIPVAIDSNATSDKENFGSKKQINNDGTDIPLISGTSPVLEMESVEPVTNLDMTKEYIIRVNTMINGKTLGYKMESFGPITKKDG